VRTRNGRHRRNLANRVVIVTSRLSGSGRWIGVLVACVTGWTTAAMADNRDPPCPPLQNTTPPVSTSAEANSTGPKIPVVVASSQLDPAHHEILDLAKRAMDVWHTRMGHRVIESNSAFCGNNCFFAVPGGYPANTLLIWAHQAGLTVNFWEQSFRGVVTQPINGCWA
jgi:hypothetical protein